MSKGRVIVILLFLMLALVRPTVAIYPAVCIRIERTETSYRFSFGGETNGAPVRTIDIALIKRGEKNKPVCELSTNGAPTIRREWMYGDVPKGYDMKGCGPLQPGTYHIEVVGGGSGNGVFKIDSGGAVRVVPQRDGGCQ